MSWANWTMPRSGTWRDYWRCRLLRVLARRGAVGEGAGTHHSAARGGVSALAPPGAALVHSHVEAERVAADRPRTV